MAEKVVDAGLTIFGVTVYALPLSFPPAYSPCTVSRRGCYWNYAFDIIFSEVCKLQNQSPTHRAPYNRCDLTDTQIIKDQFEDAGLNQQLLIVYFDKPTYLTSSRMVVSGNSGP